MTQRLVALEIDRAFRVYLVVEDGVYLKQELLYEHPYFIYG